VARVLRGALAGLAALHDAGIVHGDVKPENVLLDAEGRVLLTDFGTARASVASQTLVHATAADAGGTLLYMAPEQALGKRPSPASDLYALGAVAYELAMGKPYIEASGEGPYEVLRRIVQGARRELALPAPWATFLAKALATEPGSRHRSAEEMLGALDRLEGEGATAGLRPWRPRRPGG
jgi:serine/threonine-protein kinase